MSQEKRKELRERCRRERTDAIRALYPTPPAPAGLEEREGVELIRALTHYANILEYDDPSLRQFEATDLSKRLRSVLALLSQPPAAEGWKPIETAPKDGTMFLAFRDLGPQVYSANFIPDGRCHNRSANRWCEPTHWMPHPPAPDAHPEVAEMPGRESK